MTEDIVKKAETRENAEHEEIVEELVSTSNPSIAYRMGLIHWTKQDEKDTQNTRKTRDSKR